MITTNGAPESSASPLVETEVTAFVYGLAVTNSEPDPTFPNRGSSPPEGCYALGRDCGIGKHSSIDSTNGTWNPAAVCTKVNFGCKSAEFAACLSQAEPVESQAAKRKR